MSRAARPMSRMAPVTESRTTRMSGPFGQSGAERRAGLWGAQQTQSNLKQLWGYQAMCTCGHPSLRPASPLSSGCGTEKCGLYPAHGRQLP